MPRKVLKVFGKEDVFQLVKRGVFDKKKLQRKREDILQNSASLQHWSTVILEHQWSCLETPPT